MKGLVGHAKASRPQVLNSCQLRKVVNSICLLERCPLTREKKVVGGGSSEDSGWAITTVNLRQKRSEV